MGSTRIRGAGRSNRVWNDSANLMVNRSCAVVDCTNPWHKRDWCGAHYKRWWRYGDPLAGSTPHGECLRFFAEMSEVETEECILWPYAVAPGGYGTLHINGVSRRVPGLVCAQRHGPAPSPVHQVAHSCHTPSCFNYRHLRWTLPVENVADKQRAGTWGVKLTPALVAEIRQRVAAGTGTWRGLAKEYGVSNVTIGNIVTRRTWKWVP